MYSPAKHLIERVISGRESIFGDKDEDDFPVAREGELIRLSFTHHVARWFEEPDGGWMRFYWRRRAEITLQIFRDVHFAKRAFDPPGPARTKRTTAIWMLGVGVNLGEVVVGEA
ncbi:MAG: hypothetical protein R3B13_01865 [Polyangiaceae bacterium]